MEINANISQNSIIVSEPKINDDKTGLERVTEAIADGKKIREEMGQNATAAAGGGAGGSDMSEIIESLEKMIEMLKKQIEALTKALKDASDPQTAQTIQAQISSLQTQMLEMEAKIFELGGGIDFQA